MKRFAYAAALVLALSFTASAQEDVFKAKCAMCHGADGKGRVAVAGTKLSEEEIVALISKGAEGKKAPHGKAVAGVTEEQAKATAKFVKGLK